MALLTAFSEIVLVVGFDESNDSANKWNSIDEDSQGQLDMGNVIDVPQGRLKQANCPGKHRKALPRVNFNLSCSTLSIRLHWRKCRGPVLPLHQRLHA